MIGDTFEALLAPTTTVPKHPSDTAFPTIFPDPPIFQKAGVIGHRTLWVVFALMLVSTIAFIGLSWTVPATKRIYHSLTSIIVLIATLSYFAMATESGFTMHHSKIREHHEGNIPDTWYHVHREVYYARYIDWVLTTPLLLLDLSLLAGLNGATILTAVTADVVMILSGLFSALGYSRRQKWGWFGVGILGYLWILFTLLVTARNTVNAKGPKVARFYTLITVYSLIVWTAYPVIWGLVDGRRILDVDSEIIAYGVLDVLAKGVFGVWLLLTHRSLPESHVDLGGFWAHGLNTEGTIRIQDDEEGA